MIGFPPDFTITYDGQTYRPLGFRPFTTKDGNDITLIEWETNCPRCEAPFIATTTMNFRWPNRRCNACKRPGITMRSVRRKLRRQIAGAEP